jgi:type VI secretion system secreted protein VgrG
VIVGSMNNALNMAAFDLPHQSALTAIRSRELIDGGGNAAAGRSNHVVLDDTAHKIQVQIKSDHLHTQVGMGHLSRIEDNDGRKEYRGEGLEARTDGHAAVRAQSGLLVTTEGRPAASGHMLSMDETVDRLALAQSQHESLGDYAQQAKAQDKKDQALVAKSIHAQVQETKGDAADKAANTSAANQDAFPEFQKPHLVLASPAGIQSTTPKTTHIASGEHIALTSGGHTSISADKSLLATVKEAIRLLALEEGINVFAAKGNVDIQAQSALMNLMAQGALTIKSVGDDIYIMAKKNLHLVAGNEVKVNGAGSMSQWDATGILHETAGTWTEHAKQHLAPKEMNRAVDLTSLVPIGISMAVQQKFALFSAEGIALHAAEVMVFDDLNKIFHEKLEKGKSIIYNSDIVKKYNAIIGLNEKWTHIFHDVEEVLNAKSIGELEEKIISLSCEDRDEEIL